MPKYRLRKIVSETPFEQHKVFLVLDCGHSVVRTDRPKDWLDLTAQCERCAIEERAPLKRPAI